MIQPLRMTADNTVWVRDGSRVSVRHDAWDPYQWTASARPKTLGRGWTISRHQPFIQRSVPFRGMASRGQYPVAWL